jgi:hypothetical protein
MLSKYVRVLSLSTLLSSVAIIAVLAPLGSAQSVEANAALQRGYRTGYSDGYMAGYRDTIDSVAKDYSRHNDYGKAERAFKEEYGAVEDYRYGYKQGFESGYDTGYERRSFESSLPKGLKIRGSIQTEPAVNTTDGGSLEASTDTEAGTSDSDQLVSAVPQTDPDADTKFQAAGNAVYLIPRDTELVLELDQDLNTKTSREGEKFTARIVSPSEIAGAIVEGHITKVRKAGRLKRRSELLLSFDRILLTNDRWSNISAQLIEVVPIKGDNVRRVDNEGTAVGKSSMKSDAKKVGGATGAGLVVGAIAGGPVGAAVGAGVGAAFGVGAVVIDRGNHIRLNRNQQLRIRTAYETQIR